MHDLLVHTVGTKRYFFWNHECTSRPQTYDTGARSCHWSHVNKWSDRFTNEYCRLDSLFRRYGVYCHGELRCYCGNKAFRFSFRVEEYILYQYIKWYQTSSCNHNWRHLLAYFVSNWGEYRMSLRRFVLRPEWDNYFFANMSSTAGTVLYLCGLARHASVYFNS